MIETSTKRHLQGGLWVALLMGTVFSGFAAAEGVLLKSVDGSINLSGDLVEFADQFYVLHTKLGDLRISSERVRCEGAGCPAIETVTADVMVAGSDTVGLGLMPLLLQGYAGQIDAEAAVSTAANSQEATASFVGDSGYGDDIGAFLVSSTGSSDAFTALHDNIAQIGMSSRRIKPNEARALKGAGAGNMISATQEHIIAVDGLVMIVHPSNPIQALTSQQVRDIYSGAVTNWSELGGEDLEIKPVSRQDGSGTQSVFIDRLLAKTTLSETVTAFDNNDMASTINVERGAVGYVGMAFLRGAKPLPLINECGITTSPDSFSAKTEEYALQRRLYLYNRADVSDPMVTGLLDFAKSTAADGVIRKAGFIDLGVEMRSQGKDTPRSVKLASQDAASYEGNIARQMLEQISNYDRLSTTFRFRTASMQLDERGKLDMKRLAEFIKEQPETRELIMVGFTDDVGAFDANLALATDRATAMVAQFKAAHPELDDRVLITAKGYGEIAPVACNISEPGRAINRRVEVWLRTTPGLSG